MEIRALSEKRMGQNIRIFITIRLRKQLYLCRLPDIFLNNRIMLSVHQNIVILLHKMILVSCSMNFFCLSASIGNLTAVYRIFRMEIRALSEKRMGQNIRIFITTAVSIVS